MATKQTSTGCCDAKHKDKANMKKLADGNLEFAIKLYQAILNGGGDDDNLFCSPFSITAALAMTYAGARSNTAEEMKKCMKLEAIEDVHLAMEDILASLNLGKEADKNLPFILHCANQMYVQNNYNIMDSYASTLAKHYGTQPELVNFCEKAEETREQINTWVEHTTRDKIKDLIAPGLIDQLTRMVLVNAIYFKGTWTEKFDPEVTKEEEFFVNNEDKTTVKMMHIKKKFPYAENHDLKCKILEMPYEGDRLVMYFILPDDIEGLSALEKQLTPSVFNDLKSKLINRGKITVSIPKFRLESTVPLSETLQTLGMKDLFAERGADLSGITGNRELHVSAVIHKAFVEVNEQGTEAAAATAVIIARLAFFNPPEFIANHPFLFAIYDKHTDLVLFLGRLKRPTA